MATKLVNTINTLSRGDLGTITVCVMDLETEVQLLPDGTYDPSPYGPKRPPIIAEALHWPNDAGHKTRVYAGSALRALRVFPLCGLLVGHNFKFDYQHMLAHGCAPYDGVLWDTMVAEYILTGQQTKFASLDELMKKYLGRSKKDLIGENLKVGITPSLIPFADLEAYAKEDVVGTWEVMVKQWYAANPVQRALIMVQSTATLAYGDMELNGLPLDKAEAVRRRDKALKRSSTIQQWFKDYWLSQRAAASPVVPLPEDIKNAAPEQFCTNRALSAMLYHRPTAIQVEFPLSTPTGRKRKGADAIAWAPAAFGACEPIDPITVGAEAHKDGVSYSVSEEVLQKIVALNDPVHSPIAKNTLLMRAAHKLGTTYYQNLLEFAETYGDDRIHHTIHATSTDTGRTSSAKPNSQNQPEEVREVIVAPEGWEFLEFDFSQLEVCALAHLSGCSALQDALRRGDDIHYLTGVEAGLGATWRSKHDMPKDVRRNIKSVVFGLIYGGGVKTLAEQSGVPEETVKDIIEGFYRKFPGTRKWAMAYYDVVVGAPTRTEIIPGDTGTVRRHYVMSQTGRMYAFTEKPSPEWMAKRGTTHSFSPTQTKNHPVQGFATGDIVPLTVMLLRERLWETRKVFDAKLVTAVHDSVLLMIPATAAARTHAKAALDDVLAVRLPPAMMELWGIRMAVPLKYEYEFKPTWAAKKE